MARANERARTQSRPLETRNQRDIRKIEERNAMRDAKREADLEARLRGLIADERERMFKNLGVAFAKFYGPYEKRLTDLQDRIDNMKGRDGVSVVGAAINRNGELMLTLSDGTVLTPGPVGELKQHRGEVEPIDVPNVLDAPSWQ